MQFDIEIKKADSTHINQLKALWKVCFGDSDSYIDFFFENRFSSCYAIVCVCKHEVIGAMYLMPVKATVGKILKSGFYEYAIGVLPQYRGKGIYLKMHEKTLEYINQNNMFCILSPANKKLSEYYLKQGFKKNAYVQEKILRRR